MPEATIRSILDAIPLPALFLGEGDRVEGLNARAAALFGTVEGWPLITVIRQPALLEAVAAARAQGQPMTARYTTKDATQDVLYTAHCAPLQAGPAAGLLITLEDITDQQQIGQMRRDFVANVSHELRTPLTALIGFIETLQGSARDDPVARERFLGIMSNEAQRMNRLVRDLLSLSQVEEMERVRPETRLDLTDLLRSVVGNLTPLAAKAGGGLHMTAPAGPLFVEGDADQLRQVFGNLIENAIKYGGRPPEVALQLTTLERDPGLRCAALHVAVTDNGPGIDPVHIPRLTERFYRVDGHRSREMGGTGLGLAIVKHIVSRHRGRLRIDSTPGQGSRFSVILPRVM
jgi:two-component system, OmpR family, phosphate regulon sensor histidine kinase PhoR